MTAKRPLEPHVVVDIRFSPKNGESRLLCSCGTEIVAASCDRLAFDWKSHRDAVGLGWAPLKAPQP